MFNDYRSKLGRSLTMSAVCLLIGCVTSEAMAFASPKPSQADVRLMKAIDYSSLNGVESALNSGADVNAVGPNHRTALQEAVNTCSISSRTSIVNDLLDHGANPNIANPKGEQPLMAAVREDDVSLVATLIAHGANAAGADDIDDGETLVSTAIQNNDLTVTKLLIDHGAAVVWPPDAQVPDPVQLACASGNSELLKLVLSGGADIHRTPGILGYSTTPEDVQILFDHGAILYEPNSMGQPPLIAVLKSLSGTSVAPVLQALLQRGADPNIHDASGKPALTCAVDDCENGTTLPVMLLLNFGGKANTCSTVCWTPLMEAAYYGEPNVVTLLIQHGAIATTKDQSGRTALTTVAATGGFYNSETAFNPNEPLKTKLTQLQQIQSAQYTADGIIAETLLNHGASAIDQSGRAALELSVESDKAAVTHALLAAGGNPNAIADGSISRYQFNDNSDRKETENYQTSNFGIKMRQGITLLMLACMYSADDSIRELLNHGASLKALDSNGDSAISYAVISGDLLSFKLLLAHGANPNIHDKYGETAMGFASQMHRTAILAAILQKMPMHK